MKGRTIFLISFLLSVIAIFVLANRSEHGDMNAISMYFVVFLGPVLLLAVLNVFYVRALNKLSNKLLKSMLGMVPVIVLCSLSLVNDLTIPIIDGNLVFAAIVGAIALGITNLLWGIINLLTESV